MWMGADHLVLNELALFSFNVFSCSISLAIPQCTRTHTHTHCYTMNNASRDRRCPRANAHTSGGAKACPRHRGSRRTGKDTKTSPGLAWARTGNSDPAAIGVGPLSPVGNFLSTFKLNGRCLYHSRNNCWCNALLPHSPTSSARRLQQSVSRLIGANEQSATGLHSYESDLSRRQTFTAGMNCQLPL